MRLDDEINTRIKLMHIYFTTLMMSDKDHISFKMSHHPVLRLSDTTRLARQEGVDQFGVC